MKYRATQPFWKAFAQLAPEMKEQARQSFRLFQQGAENPPFHPSLRIRKMQGQPNIWEGHITLQYVFTFHIEQAPDTGERVYVFRNVGTHDIYRHP